MRTLRCLCCRAAREDWQYEWGLNKQGWPRRDAEPRGAAGLGAGLTIGTGPWRVAEHKVRVTKLGAVIRVSTIFQGIDGDPFSRRPLLWETLLEGHEAFEHQVRWGSRQQALRQHRRVVRALRNHSGPLPLGRRLIKHGRRHVRLGQPARLRRVHAAHPRRRRRH